MKDPPIRTTLRLVDLPDEEDAGRKMRRGAMGERTMVHKVEPPRPPRELCAPSRSSSRPGSVSGTKDARIAASSSAMPDARKTGV